MLPFPSNPTGGIMERQDLEALAQVLRDTEIMVVSDEIYAELTYGQRMCPWPIWRRCMTAPSWSTVSPRATP